MVSGAAMGSETYSYGRGGGTGLFFLLFVVVVIVGGALLATSGASGFRPTGASVGTTLATLAYLAVAGIGGWLAWNEVQGARPSGKAQQPIELRPGTILAPSNPAGRRLVELSYSGITELKVDNVAGTPWLYIRHRNGKLAIASDAMESYSAFQRMLTSLELRVTMARGRRKAS